MQGKEQLAVIVGAELEAAISLLSNADAGSMQLALDYAAGKQPANDDKNNDANREAVSLDVADMVEAVYAQMAPALEDAGGIEFEAVAQQDEPAAQQESAIVRTMLMEGYSADGGFVALSEGIKDCLLMRTGVLCLYVERLETETPEEWDRVPELALGQVTQPTEPGQIVRGVDIAPDDEGMREQAKASDTPLGDLPRLYKVKLTRVSVDKRLCVSAVARENFVASSLGVRDPNQMRFCADRMVTTRARLVAEGFDEAEVKKLPRHDPTRYELWLQRDDGANIASAYTTEQEATETVEVWRCYPMLSEAEGDVRAKRYRLYYSRDAKVIVGEPEPIGRVCYAIGNTMLYPHRLDGVSMFDRIGEVQEIKTKALRGWVENLHKVNRPRLGVDESLVNLADAQDATQDIIRMKGPNAIVPVPSIDAGPSVQMFLQYMDEARAERGGASLEMQSAGAQISGNQTAHGIERQYSVKEQLAAMMARTFGETGLRSAFQIAHYLLRTQWGDQLTMKVGGEWVEVNPSQWRPRNGVRVRIGQSETQRAKRAVNLQTVMNMQVAAMQNGLSGQLTDLQRMYNAASDFTAAVMLPGPDRYWIDPSSDQARKAAQASQAQQQRSMAAQAAGMRAALMLDKYKADVGNWQKFVDTVVKAAIEEAKLMHAPEPLQAATELAAGGAAATSSQAQGDVQAGSPGGDAAEGEPAHPLSGQLPMLADAQPTGENPNGA